MVLDEFLCAKYISHQMSQLFVGIITVVRVCRSGTGCFGLLRLQLRVGVGASEGSKNGVMVHHPRRNRVSAFAAKYREIHGLHWNQVSRAMGSTVKRAYAFLRRRYSCLSVYLSLDRWRSLPALGIVGTFAGFPFLTKSTMVEAVRSGCSR